MISHEQLALLRAQTPGLDQGLHFNHAGASLLPQAALQAIQAHLQLESRVGPMEAALMVADRLQAMREDAARLINAGSEEIAFMTSGSSAFGSVFAALPPFRQGERILVSRQEWGGNLANYQRAAQATGAVVEVMPCRTDGSVDAGALANCIDQRVRLISLTWLPANGGLINDAVAVGKVAAATGVPYIIDAGQALGQVPVDVKALQCDVLKSAGRKHLRGPRGTALLYVRKAFLEHLQPAWVDVSSAPVSADGPDLRSDARRFETSENAVALQLGLAEAIRLALDIGAGNITAAITSLATTARQRLARIPAISLHDLGDGPQSGIISFNLRGHDAMALKNRLAQQRIYIGANGVPYTPLDMQARGLHSIARVSLSYLNTLEDVEKLAQALEGLA
ncbi:aminotransferase class V-fold PLP-dependent enzyme [Undibacterium sp. TS12]|uniref:aminotransferase class V-fold PLP-dependent enzyme n=1 Tax=Undibacterium sp. TS12 TaxID=2908202 RepID=UPI001F4D086A|nr:aminotransferase class V-fold PLP-dependent enzyme [Undibacterium sp. TS12]MCH8620458.1 aminotransferase class V-fold PLP-dependent enzyme [Undibacterium sp. TS12]